ncbi:MAG: TolC family protein [Myxococcales bacterium]|nr:TolC family protein [Myxococcales bacterium]
MGFSHKGQERSVGSRPGSDVGRSRGRSPGWGPGRGLARGAARAAAVLGAVGLASSGLTSLALAQPKAEPAGPAPASGGIPAARPELDDPLLAPVPAAPFSISSWSAAQQTLLRSSTDLQRAEAALVRAEALWRQALAVLLPNARLTVAGAFDLDNPDTAPGVPPQVDGRSSTAPVVTAALSVSQRVVDVASWRARDAAALTRRSATWSLFDVRRRVRQRLARTLVAVVTAERVAELGRVGLRQALERGALSQRTFELGRATELDVLRARQDVTAARSSLIVADEQLRGAREALAVALGVDDPVGVRQDFSLDGLVLELRQTCQPLAAAERRADEEAASAAVDAARTRTASARAGKLPTLDLSTTLSALTTDPGPGRVSSWSIVAVLSVPLWEGGVRSAQVKERSALEADARATAEEIRRGARLEITRARRGQAVAETLVTVAAESRALAERLDQMTRRSFEIGRATSLELVQSAVGLRQAELALALRQFEWMQARLDALLTEARCDS